MDDKKSDGVFPQDRGKPSVSFDDLAKRFIDVEGNSWLPRRGSAQNPIESATFSAMNKLVKLAGPLSSDCEGSGYSNMGFPGSQVRSDLGSAIKPRSYAESVVAANTKQVNFRTLASPVVHDGCDVVLSRESVKLVQDRLANTLYGYFLGDRVAYPVVEYFVKNNWKKFGLQKSMMNANGFFFFKFANKEGMLNVLKEGPWIIRSQPLFLSVWSPTARLEKKEVEKILVWVKIHDVPIVAYTEDGLSMIATTIGEPKLLDAYTISMCTDAWGRSSYARALIEISAENAFKEEVVIAVPEPEGEGFIKVKMNVEYEWSPCRCDHCKVFGHADESCPKQPRKSPMVVPKPPKQNTTKQSRGQVKTPAVDADGFMDVDGKKAARKPGFHVNKAKPKFEYRPVGVKSNGGVKKSDPPTSVVSQNPFDVLREEQGTARQTGKRIGDDIGDSDDEEVVEVYNETNEFMTSGTHPVFSKAGASTSSTKFSNG
ncbi:putative transcription factor interactor and regulator CCHC(Zn) family [Helianthus anomalus]